MSQIHIPVLAGELIEALDPQPGQVVVDCTFGGGGHARLVADRIGPAGTLIAIDRDPFAAECFAELSSELPCETRFISASFVEGLEQLREEGVTADLIYFDLGMSSFQVDARERGFSYSYDAPLDMRMNPDDELSALEIVNEWEERRLLNLFREYGEERYSRQIARAIVREREEREIDSTQQLVDLIKSAIPAPARFGASHPAKRVFQALRIAVNDELVQIDEALPIAWELLTVDGRFAVISFHSLEDRRAKRFLQERARSCTCPPELPVCVCGREEEAELVSRGGVVPTAAEVSSNPRSKSARLRAARKVR